MNPNSAGEPSSYQQYGGATQYGGNQYGHEEQDIDQYGDGQYDQEGNSPLRLPVTIYGKFGHEFDIFASIDNGAKESWMSLTMLNYLELPYKAAHKSQRTHSMRIDNENVESLGSVVCELSLSTAGSKLQKFVFQVYKHYFPRVILGMKSTEKEVMGKYLTKAVQSPVPQERYKTIKLLLIRWKEEGGLQCAGEVDSLRTTFWNQFSVNGDLFCIPTSNSAAALEAHVSNFANGCSAGDLLIIYYSGHGERQRGGRLGLVQ
jgi:hypothetical protein